MRKHIHDPCPHQAESELVNENSRITGQAGRMAGNVYHSVRTAGGDMRKNELRSGAGRIDQYFIIVLFQPRCRAGILTEIGNVEQGITHVIALRIFHCFSDQFSISLDTHRFTCHGKQWAA